MSMKLSYTCAVKCHMESGEKVRDLLLKHGTFKDVEISLTKKVRNSETNSLEGQYVNEATLATMHGWDESLAFQLAC